MRRARPLGLSPDGADLMVVTDDGEPIAITADARLKAAIRGDIPRLGQLEISMESALTPREIQARLRAGESLDDVAKAAGVPGEELEAFAGPVLAERRHIADLARSAQVRRRGEPSSQRMLGETVAERLLSRGIDPDTVRWDAWRGEARIWTVMASYMSGSNPHEATFLFDVRGRFSTATNEDARWLIGDDTTAKGPQPGRKRPSVDNDSEPTIDLNDQLALVRVVQDEPDIDETDIDEADLGDFGDELEDYSPAELEEVDGVYDIVTHPRGEMDVLYDMLASFNEDSVNIYAGLTQPVAPRPAPEPDPEPTPAAAHSAAEPPVLPGQGSLLDHIDEPLAPESPETPETPETPVSADEPEAEPEPEPEPEPRPKARKKRASVPSWDEIMFGSPRAD